MELLVPGPFILPSFEASTSVVHPFPFVRIAKD